MSRYRFTPPGYHDGATYPTVLMIPPAIFKDADDIGVPSEVQATSDLAAAGFLVFQIEHRLASPGMITPHDGTPGSQPGHTYPIDISGTPAEQQGDVERQILDALNDSHCNQSIYLVGGSSGGCHALWVALKSTASDNSGWNNNARMKIKAVASLSGPTDLGDFTDYSSGVNINQFKGDVENYTSTKVYPPSESDKYPILEAASPITLVQGATSVPPIRMFGTQLDTVPWQQGSNMYDAIHMYHSQADVQFHKVNLSNGDHAFHYWEETDAGDSLQRCVRQEVIDFFNEYP